MDKDTSSQPGRNAGAAAGSPERSAKRRKQLTCGLIGCSALLGLLIVLTPVLATIFVPTLVEELHAAKHERAVLQIRTLLAAVEQYSADTGAPPQTLDQLLELGPSGKPYIEGALPLDPWEHAYVYFAPTGGAAPRIVSYGGDGEPGGDDRAKADIDSAELQR
ncbi:MAG: type II secretion system protein GspG [Planctomycetes bacterium]|nr:type II secretion system protein GspG [Planctomycetota bacterium]